MINCSADFDGPPLTATEGSFGRSLLEERPLDAYLDDGERPQYCLVNHRHGVRRNESPPITPDRWRVGAALLTNSRVLFVVGQRDGDETVSVSFGEIDAVRTESRVIGTTLLVATPDETYQFPCRGNLDEVSATARRILETWRDARDHLDRGRRAVERLKERIESDEPSEMFSTIETAASQLTDARETIEQVGGVVVLAEQIDDRRADLTEFRRRAHASRGEQRFERAKTRRAEQKFEDAFDDLEAAEAAYATALEIDANQPPDESLRARQERLNAEREALAREPLASAENAVEAAAETDELAASIRSWEQAVQRYETVYTLDWGRDPPRFDVDRETARETLTEALRNLIRAYCRGARRYADEDQQYGGFDDRGHSTGMAAELLAEAEALARERVPDMLDEVRAVRTQVDPEQASECRDRGALEVKRIADKQAGSAAAERSPPTAERSITGGKPNPGSPAASEAVENENEPESGSPAASEAVKDERESGVGPTEEEVTDDETAVESADDQSV